MGPWYHFGAADEAAKSKWETIFDIPKETNEPIMIFFLDGQRP